MEPVVAGAEDGIGDTADFDLAFLLEALDVVVETADDAFVRPGFGDEVVGGRFG